MRLTASCSTREEQHRCGRLSRELPHGGDRLRIRTGDKIVEARGSLPATGTVMAPFKPAIGGIQFTNLTEEPVDVPVGTVVTDAATGEMLADLDTDGASAIIAKGGLGGLGNLHFKSSTNRAPRQFTPGEPGETRELKLELKVLADVGLLGLPNAGKSTFIRAVSAARPKVADYPFTTLQPNLGVVRVGENQSFVVADIPGLIRGASEGAGLGHRFLKHLQRTRLLLHLIDIAPMDPNADPVSDALAIIEELRNFDESLYLKPRWILLNKIDLIPEDERNARISTITSKLGNDSPVFVVSGATGEGCQRLCQKIMQFLTTANENAQ